eukprot:gene14361-16984_t
MRHAEYHKAVEKYSSALEMHVDNNLLANRATAFLRLGKLVEAREDATRVLERDPRYSMCSLQRARACSGLSLYAEALYDYRQLLKNPGSTSLVTVCNEMFRCQAALNRQVDARLEARLTNKPPDESHGPQKPLDSEQPFSERARQCEALFGSLDTDEQRRLLQQLERVLRNGSDASLQEIASSSASLETPGSEGDSMAKFAEPHGKSLARVQSAPTRVHLFDLSDPEISAILEKVEGRTLASCSQACWRLHTVCAAEFLWEKCLREEFTLVASHNLLLPSWHRWHLLYVELQLRQRHWIGFKSLVTLSADSEAAQFLERLRSGAWPDLEDCFAWEHRAVGATPIWYRFDELGQHWEWTADLLNWMPCTSARVSGGAYHNQIPVPPNVQIINTLATAPAPLCTRLDVRVGERTMPLAGQHGVLEQRRLTDAMNTFYAYQRLSLEHQLN